MFFSYISKSCVPDLLQEQNVLLSLPAWRTGGKLPETVVGKEEGGYHPGGMVELGEFGDKSQNLEGGSAGGAHRKPTALTLLTAPL